MRKRCLQYIFIPLVNMNPSVIIWGNKKTIQGCSTKKKLQNVVWYHFGHTSFVYLIQFTASSFNLPFILPSISWDKHFSVYGFSISYILFCFAKHFVFVIAQFKKPHLSRSRYPLRLLLWLQLMLVCNHHLFIFEKAKHETIFIL